MKLDLNKIIAGFVFLVMLFCVPDSLAQHHLKIERVKDINPTFSVGSNPGSFVSINGKVYFAASDGHGRELWTTDGTEQGTYMIKDINPNGSSITYRLYTANNKIFFMADDGIHGTEMWVSDGTSKGTFMLKDINQGANPDSIWAHRTFIKVFGEMNNELYFSANDSTHGVELWKTDGTSSGTILVKDIHPDSFKQDQIFLPTMHGGTAFKNRFYFTADNGVNGFELWSTDGTPNGTQMLKDIDPNGDGLPGGFYEFKGRLFFSAEDSTGRELWVTDGTVSGTYQFENINTNTIGLTSSSPHSFVEYRDNLYFNVSTAQQHQYEVNYTNGNDGDLHQVVSIPPVNYWYITENVNYQYIFHDKIFFQGIESDYGVELYVTDDAFFTSKLIKDIDTSRLSQFGGTMSSSPTHYFGFEDYLIFKAVDRKGGGRQLWVYDDAQDTLQPLIPFSKHNVYNSANALGAMTGQIVSGDYCYFIGEYDSTGVELWKMYDSTKVNGVNELETENLHQVQLYPNPSGTSFVTLKYELNQTGNVAIQLYDVSGRWVKSVIHQKEIQGNHQIQIPLDHIPKGVYLIQLQTPQGKQTLKFIRSK